MIKIGWINESFIYSNYPKGFTSYLKWIEGNGQLFIIEFQIICVDIPLFRKWGLSTLIPFVGWPDWFVYFQTECWKGKIVTLEWRNLATTTLAKWSRLTSPVINRIDIMYFLMWCDVMRGALQLCSNLPPKFITLV